MRFRMVGDLVAARGDGPHQARILLRVAANQEKRGRHVGLAQHGEEHRGVDRVGAVVER